MRKGQRIARKSMHAMMPLAERLAGTRFWTLYKKSVSGASLVNDSRMEALCKLLAHAAQTVPLWTERLAILGDNIDGSTLNEHWSSLPLLSKADLREGFPDRVTSKTRQSQWRYGSSAGTVDRVTVVSDFLKRDYVRATGLRMVNLVLGDPLAARIVEVPPDACNVVCGLRDEGPLELLPFIRWAFKKGILLKRQTLPDLRGRIERSLFIRQDTLEPLAPGAWANLVPQLDAHLDRIQASRPNIVRGLPLFMLWLAERALQRGLRFPSLKAVMPYGGLTSQSMAVRTEKGFGVPFIDYYGTSEVGGIGIGHVGGAATHDAAEASGLGVFHDLLFIEVLDDANKPLPPGKTGKIVVTDFHNYAMPLIRYEIGDVGRWVLDSQHAQADSEDQLALNKCARLEVQGRRVESCQLASGRVVTAREAMDIVFADSSVQNASVEYQRRTKRVTLLSAGGDVQQTTLDGLRQLFELEAPVQSRLVGYLRPEPSGKYCGLKVKE
jgi:phenylacetate-coenzyme A ligase PaaK-like adenylate-forming protein